MYKYGNEYKPTLINFLLFTHAFPFDRCFSSGLGLGEGLGLVRVRVRVRVRGRGRVRVRGRGRSPTRLRHEA